MFQTSFVVLHFRLKYTRCPQYPDPKNNFTFQCYGYTVDVTAREQVAAISMRMRRQLSDVTMLVSNAGIISCAPISHLRQDTVMALIETNLLAHFWVSVQPCT